MRIHWLAGVLLTLVGISFANADIIDLNCDDDGDGAIVHNSHTWDNEPTTYALSINSTQHWWPGHLLGDFTTDTELDPIVWIRNTVLNDGDVEPLVWTDYHINIFMNKTFTILDTATLPDWTVTNVTQPTLQSGQWVGTVDYLGGTPINFGDWGEFDVKLSFLGSIAYTLELIPTPEPATLLLVGLGLLLVRRR